MTTALKTLGIVGRDEPSNFTALTLDEALTYAMDCYNGDKKDFRSYSPEILAIIERYVADGHYPYNRDIEKLALAELFPTLTDECDTAHQNRYLSRIVYNTQCYRSSVQMLEAQHAFENQMQTDGYTPATPENVIVGHRYTVARQGSKPERMIARQFGDTSVLWAKQVNSRRGYYAFNGEYIK